MGEERRLAWQGQPDGISCGPTVLSMVLDALHDGRRTLDVGHVASMCGTNPTTGTTHEGVATALAGLGIRHRRATGRDDGLGTLSSAVGDGDFALCRTLTHGVKHWVVASRGESRGRLTVHDPWLGVSQRTYGEVEALVAPRDYEVWQVPSRQSPPTLGLVTVGPGFRDAAVALCEASFGRFVAGPMSDYLDATVDWEASRGLVVDGDLVGTYLLQPESRRFPRCVVDRFDGAGVEGVALVVGPGHRGRGYGRLLRDEPTRAGYDFVWGMQLKALDNVDMWLKHRDLVEDRGGVWVTGRALPGRPEQGYAAGR